MATIRKTPAGRWQALIRLKGHPPLSKTFTMRADAVTWARTSEVALERGASEAGLPSPLPPSPTVIDLLDLYERRITSSKRSSAKEAYLLRPIRRHEIGTVQLKGVRSTHVARYRDDRLRSVKPNSVKRELAVLQHAFNLAIREWGVPLPVNPVAAITKPRVSDARRRRVTEDEWRRLIAACEGRPLQPVIRLAKETGMRRGELLSLEWRNVDLTTATAFLPMTKNGEPRHVPLSQEAVAVLRALNRKDDESRVFAMSPNALRLAWERLKARAGVTDLRLHDLRHEAVSRFFERGLSVPEVALISGHKDYRMLARYTHLRAADVARKLGGL